MAVIKAKPTSPGRRGVISIKSDLYKGRPHKALLEKKLALPAYDQCLKASHIFNLLDARGVIGVAERQGEAFGKSQDNYIAIPVTNYLQKFSNKWTTLSINVEAASEKDYDKTREEVIGIMRTIRKVKAGEDNDFELETNDEMIETFSGFTSGIKLFALSVSIIALVVAGIGIMNIMLVSVTERIKEIGIRKAIGATKQDILTQFLMEAVFLSEFGGIVGIIMGISAGNLVSFIFKIPAVIPIDWAIIGLAVCSLIGIGFGIYPAWKAAQLDPIESLRFE